jgi:tetratricopeptide (TPR) repeat protein
MQLGNSEILKPGTVLFGYKVLEFVGEGAWSYVYRAQHPKLPMSMAIKQLKPEWTKDKDAVQRFLREANIIAGLLHPNVVRIYDLKHDEETGLYYIITEFAEKGTLADRLKKSPNGLAVDEVLHLAMGVCSGLAAAHRKMVVHRDIKPGNILLFDVGEERDIPKLSDFGIARGPVIEGVDAPKSSGAYGSLHYMSPEQLDPDIEVDHRSDLYSLGVLLYELLVGQVPFTGEIERVFWAHRFVSPQPPRELRPDVPEALERVVLHALRKSCKDRYQYAADMHEALENILDSSIRRERRRRFEALLKQGLADVQEEKWEAAIEALSQADALEPEDERVLDGLQRARQQQELVRLYDLGVQCMEEGNCEEALKHLAQIMSRDPDYADGQARELLERAMREFERRLRLCRLTVRYCIGVGYSLRRQWVQALEELEWVFAEDPDFEDVADRRDDLRRYMRAEQLFGEAERHKEQREWEEVVDLLEEAEQLRSPYLDVTEELEHARRRWVEIRQEQQLTTWYDEGMTRLQAGDLEQARANFQMIDGRRPGYRDVADRLGEIEKKLDLKHLFELASECESVCDWRGAIAAYGRILDTDPYDRKAARYLARVQRRVDWEDRRGLVGIVVVAQAWWIRRSRRVKAALVGFFSVIFLGLSVWALNESSLLLPAPRPTLTPPCNGNFEGWFKCWQHGGELDQTVKRDGNNRYAVLGNPDYPCYGGVPVGEAWIKQAFQVPKEISPTLSLRYRVFSHDLDLPGFDYFQVAINGEPLPERYGNYDWHEPSCDREPWDSQWQTLSLDLSDYRGEEIEVSFHNVNGTQPHYNTWTYIDDVKID